MRILLLAACLLACAAAIPAAPRPSPLGRFGDWQAASRAEAGLVVCYAFTRARPDREVVLTVTRRPRRDTVAVSFGYLPRHTAPAWLQAGPRRIGLYLAGRSAFARNGGVAVAALAHSDRAVGSFPGRGAGADGEDESFSLAGFTAAYQEAGRACSAT